MAIVDKNRLQYNAPTDEVIKLGDLKKKFEDFGWVAVDVDGHNIEELSNTLNRDYDKPLAVIAHTVKGKGISFMEDQPEWHHKALTDNLYEQAMNELNGVKEAAI